MGKPYSIKSAIDKINKYNVDEAGIRNVVKVLKSGLLSKPEGGHYVNLFQNKMSKLLGKKFSFATTSGTSSLHAAIALLGLKKHDEILVPALTFIADASVVIQEHANPVFVDVSREDFNINPKDVSRKITRKTKALIVVHMYGQPAKMDELKQIAKANKLVLIEDCAQAAGAKYKNNPVGSFGDISCFSFYQTKHIVCGEGGLISTNNEEYANALRSMLNNGIKRSRLEDYDFDRIGFNYQMTEIQAALAVRQLDRLNDLNITRRKHVSIYKKILSETDIHFQEENKDTYNVYCYLTGLLPEKLSKKRDLFISKILKEQVPIKKQYPLSLPETEIFRGLSIGNPADTPMARNISRRVFNLYVNPGLDEKDIIRFAQTILKNYREIERF